MQIFSSTYLFNLVGANHAIAFKFCPMYASSTNNKMFVPRHAMVLRGFYFWEAAGGGCGGLRGTAHAVGGSASRAGLEGPEAAHLSGGRCIYIDRWGARGQVHDAPGWPSPDLSPRNAPVSNWLLIARTDAPVQSSCNYWLLQLGSAMREFTPLSTHFHQNERVGRRIEILILLFGKSPNPKLTALDDLRCHTRKVFKT